MTSNTQTEPARIYLVIPCAGFGSRAGTALPKQYEPIAGVPMVVHTLKAFSQVPRITQGVLVVATDDELMVAVLTQYPQPLYASLYQGGTTRAASVKAGVTSLLKLGAQLTDWVLVHDAARCLVTPDQINALIDACIDDEVGGLLAYKVADTLKAEVNGRVAHTVDRTDKWQAQTPQMFRIGTLLKALEQTGETVTDEASAIEALGLSPLLVSADAHNFKVTYPQDFALAESILKIRAQEKT